MGGGWPTMAVTPWGCSRMAQGERVEAMDYHGAAGLAGRGAPSRSLPP